VIKKFRCRYLTSYCILVALLCPISLYATPYYAGKVVTLISGHGVGGGGDRIARLLAKHLPKYIPGKPTIIVSNMPGAASLIAANYLYNIAKPDGLTFGDFDQGIPFAQMLKAEGAKFDLMKFSWIGSAGSDPAVLGIRADLPYKTFDDLRKARGPIHLAANSPGAIDHQYAALIKGILGVNIKIVVYTSSSESRLAMERKEVEGKAGLYNSYRPSIESGLARLILRGRMSVPEIQNLPVDADLATDTMGKTLFNMRSAPDRVNKPYVAPPKTPPEIMKILRDAFAKVANDPECQAEAKRNLMEINYVTADECLKVYKFLLTQPADIVKEFSKYVQF